MQQMPFFQMKYKHHIIFFNKKAIIKLLIFFFKALIISVGCNLENELGKNSIKHLLYPVSLPVIIMTSNIKKRIEGQINDLLYFLSIFLR